MNYHIYENTRYDREKQQSVPYSYSLTWGVYTNSPNRNGQAKIADVYKRQTRYYIDEFHLLLKEEQTAAYSVEIWKRFRKWGGIPTGITQNAVSYTHLSPMCSLPISLIKSDRRCGLPPARIFLQRY